MRSIGGGGGETHFTVDIVSKEFDGLVSRRLHKDTTILSTHTNTMPLPTTSLCDSSSGQSSVIAWSTRRS